MRQLFAATALLATTSAAGAAPPQVLADTPVAASLVALVSGDLARPEILLPAGSSAHHYQMRPSDAAALQSADLLVWFGPELTPWLSKAASAGGGADLELLHVTGTRLRGYDPDEAADDQNHPQDDAGDDHDGHDHAGTDPHAWLNPANAGPWLAAIAARLSELDPGNAGTYSANAEAAAGALARMDAEIARELAPVRGQSFVVLHDAYGYFTDHYELPPAIAVSLGDAAGPSAARLTEVRSRIAQSGAACAFPEQAQNSKLIRTAIDGSDVSLGKPLDPSGTALAVGPGLYEDLIRTIARTLLECLSAR
ncbi:zinc ABC transporter substrate-binding protein [Paracoccus marinaquae]|uniref:High-affinity zinc uptake system protein ZnuA n=1 Tax=Paracoccus marinaquae TaxID=2841926 RepID=A0ABS6AHW9_9RHOB|nr:zinc ABC transporter substrate-binding protein [Paracoccus marinaquae]MBU3030193.1 zinc ABC transporter substrate-binding protein [Paracoccus marinaquae]